MRNDTLEQLMIKRDWLSEKVDILLRQAGKQMLSTSNGFIPRERKSAANYVTAVDYAVQQEILTGLQQLTPQFPVIAEEKDIQPDAGNQPVWILDPIDGTTNFMHHYQQSAISLALTQQNRALMAWIYNPYLNELFYACSGQGAFLNGEQIHVSQVSQLSDSLIGFGTNPYDRHEAHLTFQLAETIFLQSLELRRSGSAALDLAHVAAGRLDGFFERCQQLWDYAAGALILQEAGGQITNWQGDPPGFVHEDSVLATNGLIHSSMAAIIADGWQNYYGCPPDKETTP
jgi:myo-inositol-1(or 4)-monophosphatase